MSLNKDVLESKNFGIRHDFVGLIQTYTQCRDLFHNIVRKGFSEREFRDSPFNYAK